MAIVLMAALATHRVEGQRYQHQVLISDDQQNPNEVGSEFAAGERVDKLASASGDAFYQRPQTWNDWYHQLALSRPEMRQAESNQYQLVGSDLTQQQQQQSNHGQLILDPYSLDYRALINEFKRESPLANPSRESRAFKPKLMSTARGFGKRASSLQRHVTYADLLAAANPSGLLAGNGKLSGNTIRLVEAS